MIAARQIAFGKAAGDSGVNAVKYSACGDGIFGSVFTSQKGVSFDFKNGFTMTAWAKRPLNTHGHFCTFGSDGTGMSLGGGASSASETNGNHLNGLANSRWWLPSTSICFNDGEWHHCAVVVNSGQWRGSYIFFDGVRVGSVSYSGSEVTRCNEEVSQMTLLGVCDGGENRFMTGLVSRVCVFNRALLHDEVLQDFSIRAKYPTIDGLIHAYGFEANNGILVDSVSGLNLHAKNGAYISDETID